MTRTIQPVQPHFRPIRRLQLMSMPRDDPFEPKRKLAEPSVCESCGVLWSGGRWRWGEAPQGATPVRCPACRRALERAPAGYLRLSGPGVEHHRAQLLGLIRNHERRECTEHPLQRVMDVEEQDNGLLLTTTDIHLARGLGEAIQAAHGGRLAYRYNKDQQLLYVTWRG